MKPLNAKLFGVLLILFVGNTIFLAQDSNPLLKKNYAKAELNFLLGLESDITGVRANSAYYLGEMKSQASVGYLIDMIHRDKCLACRIVAALSLLKIGDKTGIQEVKKIREFAPPDPSSDKNYIFYLSILWHQYLESHPEDALVLRNIQFPDEV